MSSSAVVGIGAGIGALFLCAACFVIFQIYKRKREHNREIAEIEQGFPPARPVEVAHLQGPGACQLPFVPSYVPCGGWGALASTETINHLPPFAQVNNRIHPAFIFPEEQTRTTWNFPGRRPRIGRMPSGARRLQALSAIIESPRGGTPGAGSRASPSAAKGGAVREQEIQSASVEQLIAKPEIARIDSPQIPPRSSSRPIQLSDEPPPKPLMREPSRPRAARSKSLGTVSDPNKPNSTTTFASAPGPAPTGPLPPLPPLPRNISRQSDYNPANRHSALGIPSVKHSESTSTSVSSSPERNWERIVSFENVNFIPKYKNTQKSLSIDDTAAEAGAEDSSNGGNLRSASYIGHRRSVVCLSIISNGSKRNSCSSLASALGKQSNRLSIPQILNVDRISISRVSSSGSLSSSSGGVTMVSTPRRHIGSSRVSATGSPSEKTKSSVLRAVSGNAGSPQRPMKSALRDSKADAMPKWEKSMFGPKHSILKGSPSARKGHRRQNCVRLSTLAPTVLGPGSRSGSASRPINGIQEESSDRKFGPVAEKHLNGDVTLRPRTIMDPLRLRASLTPSSPTLSMVAYQNEPLPWNSEVNSRRASYVSQGVKSPLSREASLFSIPSLPDMSHVGQDEDAQQGSETPTIEFTRPSTEWSEHERTPPFGLRVTPSSSRRSVYNPELSPPLPSWSHKYDPFWPMLVTNPPASGQEYDVNRPISVYSSDEDSSSTSFPFAVKDEPASANWSSPLSFLGDYEEEEEEVKWSQSDKENDSPYASAAALERIRSPFESMPILRPHTSLMEDLDASLPSPPASPNSSICKTPPLLCRTVSNVSNTVPSAKPSNPNSSAQRQNRRSSSISPRRRSGSSSPNRRSGGIEKPSSRSERVTGPRAQPPKDIRKSIMALRRMNSSLQFSADEMGEGSQRYLHLGREASPKLPFDFGFENSDNEDDPPKDILFEQDEEDQEEEKESRACQYVTYSPTKPVLSLLTTLPEASRTPRTQLSVWDNGEGYWNEQERRVTEAVTSSPVDTPTNALDRMLGWEGKDEQQTSPVDSGKGNTMSLQVLNEGEDTTTWDKRQSKAIETPKSVKSLYDQQGFWQSPC
ncbi:hypothetical protein D6D06_09028 [Aureobasidium pullulans]|nr:hypothetical protein D6D06_09028 [Aureobasidium pullulans]